MSGLAFIACTEPGDLEKQSLLLFRSIRKFGGRFKDAPIHSFQPRKGLPLKKETLKLFDRFYICHHDKLLNQQFDVFPRTNKIFSCAWAEENFKEDILVFLDSDTLFLNEPVDFLLNDNNQVAIRPVDSKNISSEGKNDVYDSYWKKLFEICKVPAPPYITTTIDQKKIRAHWNSGLIIAKRTSGIFQKWKEDFLKVMRKNHLPPVNRRKKIGIPFLDQTVLAATLAKFSRHIYILPDKYNYCLPKRGIMPSPYRNIPFEELIHVHYHQWFHMPGFLEALKPPVNRNSGIYRWVSSNLPFHPIIYGKIPYQDL